ncbi:hypothetical protein K523DRAFT_352421 [Schizophyllum commune Tattone D]|nr:hypothetical protein K523DRAFT_352421 [Schizophyllum commune Tattone D]
MATQSPDKDVMNREFARMSGMLYDLNPRNFEDRWYALVGIELNRLCRHIKCNAIATAQDSLWAGNTYPDSIRLANVVVKLGPSPMANDKEQAPIDKDPVVAAQLRASKLDTQVAGNNWMADFGELPEQTAIGTSFEDPNVMNEDQGEAEQPATTSQTPHDSAPSASQEAHGTAQESNHTGNAQQNGPSPKARSPEMMQPYQPSMSARTVTGGNRHRVPDSAINGYISIDYTLEEMKKATEERESWTTAAVNKRRARLARAPAPPNPTTNVKNLQAPVAHQSTQETKSRPSQRPLVMDRSTGAIHDELEKLPRTDPDDFDALINPLPIYRDHAGLVVEFKLLNAESKRLPSRQQTAQTTPAFDASLTDLMRAAQVGNLEQIRVFFASPHWDHQESVMLLATAGDFGTHTIATRDSKAEKPTFTIQPWSFPVWFGSKASERREAKMIQWINETFSPEAMREVAVKLREEAILRMRERQERQKTPPEDDNADGGDGPTGPPGPPEPPADPKTRKRKHPSNPEQPRRSVRNRPGNPYARTTAQNERADAPPPGPPIPGTGDEPGTNYGRPAQDTANRADAQPGPHGTPESASCAPPTRRTKPMPRRLGPNGPADLMGKGKARAEPVVENEQDDASSAQSEPDDARPTKKARQHSPAEASDASEAPPPDSPAFSDMSALTDIPVLEEQIQKDNDALTALQKEEKRILDIQALQAAVRRPINRALTGQPSVPAGPSGANGRRSVQEPSRLTRSRSTRY